MSVLSIVIATRNRTNLLHDALRSLVNQDFVDCEFVVVDDGSSAEVIATNKAFCQGLDGRIRYIEPSSPGCRGSGPSGARNRGARLATSEFLGFLDDDDAYCAPSFARIAIGTLQAHCGDLFFGLVQGHKNGSYVHPCWSPPLAFLDKLGDAIDPPDVLQLPIERLHRLARPYTIHPGQMIVRKQVFDDCGGFFEGLWSNAEDRNLSLRLLDRAERVYAWRKPSLLYRLPTEDSISLTESSELHVLQRILAGQHAELRCRRPKIIQAARAGVAWSLRELSQMQMARGNLREATYTAAQSFVAYPSPGAIRFLVQHAAQCARRLFA